MGGGGGCSLLGEAGAAQLSNLILLPPDPRPWTSFELNAFGGKPLRGRGQRPCWPGSEGGHNRRSRQKRQTIGGGGTTPSSTPSWPGTPAGRTPLWLTDSRGVQERLLPPAVI